MNDTRPVELTVLIPALNERANLDLLLPAIQSVLARLTIAGEVLVVDGGSSDGTPDAAVQYGARPLPQTERGYGGALLAGFAEARGTWILTMDADQSHPADFLEVLWQHRHDADVLIASRYVPGGSAVVHWSRRVLSIILNQVYRRLLALPIRDVSSGFRLYRREAIAGLKPEARDFDFQEEILILAYCNGEKLSEVPFRYLPRVSGRSHVHLLRFGQAYLRTLGRMYRLRRSKAR